jgi:hypothetical protein
LFVLFLWITNSSVAVASRTKNTFSIVLLVFEQERNSNFCYFIILKLSLTMNLLSSRTRDFNNNILYQTEPLYHIFLGIYCIIYYVRGFAFKNHGFLFFWTLNAITWRKKDSLYSLSFFFTRWMLESFISWNIVKYKALFNCLLIFHLTFDMFLSFFCSLEY